MLLCQCVATDYEIRRNYPSPALYFSPLLHPTHPHARPRWSAQGMRTVGRSSHKFPALFRCADSFTWAMRIPSTGQR